MEASENRVYVGNLPFKMGFEQLKELFSSCGEIVEATVVVNHYTGRSKGFGFVTFATEEGAKKAISDFDGKEVEGRNIKVSEAKPFEEKPREERPRRDDDRPRSRSRY